MLGIRLDRQGAPLDPTSPSEVNVTMPLQALASPVIEPAPTDPQNGVAIPAMGASEPGRDDEHMDRDV